MRELQLGSEVVEGGPEPRCGDNDADFPPRHEAAEGTRHADVLVDAETQDVAQRYTGAIVQWDTQAGDKNETNTNVSYINKSWGYVWQHKEE